VCPNCQPQIRELLHHGSPLSADLLEAISAGLDVPIQALPWFAGHGNEGITSRGSAVAALIGLERLGSPIQEVHVPLAHQSALESP
jgi:hypothetical protein